LLREGGMLFAEGRREEVGWVCLSAGREEEERE